MPATAHVGVNLLTLAVTVFALAALAIGWTGATVALLVVAVFLATLALTFSVPAATDEYLRDGGDS